jgi:sulfite reductase beta subunit-like hemoprotein
VASYSAPKPALPGSPLPRQTEEAFAHWARTNVAAEKQQGYYGVTVQLPLGDINPAQLRALANFARMVGNGTLRTCNDQNIYVPSVPGDRVAELYRLLESLRLAAPDALHISDVVSCPGADFCSLAVSRSMGMAAAIRKHLLANNGEVEALGVLRIRISGCPNSCGQHHVGDIGLTGLTVKAKDGTEVPYYSMLVGGQVGEDDAAIGERLGGKYPATSVPRIISSLASYYRAHRLDGERFGPFVRRVGLKPLYEIAQSVGAAGQ